MLQAEVNVTELRAFAKSLPQMKGRLFELMQVDVKRTASEFLNGLLSSEFSLFIGREKYERQQMLVLGGRNFRNGYYSRSIAIKGIGSLSIKMPRDRKGLYQTALLPKYCRTDDALKEDLAILYLMGMSTRALSLVSKRILGHQVSHAEVSNCSQKLVEAVEAWRIRPITEKIKYVYIDGTNFTMRVGEKIEKVCVLVVIGVNESNQKQVLALQAGDKESATSWRELFKDLKGRGLDPQLVRLGIMDGLSGLEIVFEQEFPRAKIQRCQVHVARNVITKVPHSLKLKVADDMRSIFYAGSKDKAESFFKDFQTKWEKDLPSAVKCLKSSIDSTLRFFDFPQDEWTALRTTNPIERLNKEFKRRTKPMEIVAGEKSCYNLLAVICLRMEAGWKRRPINLQTLPGLMRLEEFTQ